MNAKQHCISSLQEKRAPNAARISDSVQSNRDAIIAERRYRKYLKTGRFIPHDKFWQKILGEGEIPHAAR
ncbi:MAG: hypothetical protein WC421_02690 [Elusimicrobiales bacterium]